MSISEELRNHPRLMKLDTNLLCPRVIVPYDILKKVEDAFTEGRVKFWTEEISFKKNGKPIASLIATFPKQDSEMIQSILDKIYQDDESEQP